MRKLSIATEIIVLATVFSLQLFVSWTVATDFHGDPVDYVHVAQSWLGDDNRSLSFLRFPGFPLFIAITSIDFQYLEFTFLMQSVVFMIALIWFGVSLTSYPFLRVLVYLPALLPTVAYAQKLLFPDGLILSLLLFFGAAIHRRRLRIAGLIAVLLIVVKLVFISLLLVVGVLWLAKRAGLAQRLAVLAVPVGFVTLWIAVYLAFPLPIYQTIVQRPTFLNGPEDRNGVSNARLDIRCGDHDFRIVDPAVLARVREHSASVLTPIGSELAEELNCSSHDVETIQRDVIIREIKRDAIGKIGGVIDRTVRGAVVAPQTSHLRYMLVQKAALLDSHFGQTLNAHYDELELESFADLGIATPPARANWLIQEAVGLDEKLGRVLTIVAILSLFLSLGLTLYSKVLWSKLLPLACLAFVYNVMLGLFAFIYDRYVLVNYFLWLGIVIVALTVFFEMRGSGPVHSRVKRAFARRDAQATL